jgi:hypothetical protein
MERVADVLEMASAEQDRINAEGRAAVDAANRPQTHPDFDGLHCVEEDCGVELPPVRLAYKRIRCSTCQQRVEDVARRQGRR